MVGPLRQFDEPAPRRLKLQVAEEENNTKSRISNILSPLQVKPIPSGRGKWYRGIQYQLSSPLFRSEERAGDMLGSLHNGDNGTHVKNR